MTTSRTRSGDTIRIHKAGFGHVPAGFTLIEMLVVIAIIGILAGLIMGAVKAVRSYARTVEAKGVIEALGKAIDKYRADNGGYPIEQWTGATGTVGESLLYQLRTYGRNPPYLQISEVGDYDRLHSATPSAITATSLPTDVQIIDPWGIRPNLDYPERNFYRYWPAPQLGDTELPPLTYDEYGNATTGLAGAQQSFHGNKHTYHLWSFGPDRKDNSSDMNAAAFGTDDPIGHMGGDPSDSGDDTAGGDGIGDDIVNW